MSIVAKHAQGKGGPDKIFSIRALATARAAEVGEENILNAVTGSFLDDNGKLMTNYVVEKVAKEIPFYKSCDYASIAGSDTFVDAAIEGAFRDYRPNGIIKGLATPGGTGSIFLAIKNYLEPGEMVVCMDRCWANYKNICKETGREFVTFPSFTEQGGFNVEGCIAALRKAAENQKNVFLILNSPANNPTGYNMKKDEMKAIMDEMRAISTNGKNNGIVLMDIAYIDFAAPEAREMFLELNDLPENLIGLVAFSMSKSYAMYGYRLGCLLCVTSSEAEAESFLTESKFTARATWSNSSMFGMLVMETIYKDAAIKAEFRAEQERLRLILLKRADMFIQEAKEVGLPVCPFDSGFFVTVPTEKAEECAAALRDQYDIYVVPLGSGASAGLRVALCAIPDAKIPGIPTKMKAILDQIG